MMLTTQPDAVTREEKASPAQGNMGAKIETGKFKHQDDEVTTNKHAI